MDLKNLFKLAHEKTKRLKHDNENYREVFSKILKRLHYVNNLKY